MKVNTRFTVALHIMTLMDLCVYKGIVSSSENLALSVNTNPVVIRRLLSQLKKAGLIETRHGVAGATLTRKPKDITLLDIYNAVKKPEDTIFDMHHDTNQKCYVGANIHEAVNPILQDIEDMVQDKLSKFTLYDVIEPIAIKNNIQLG